MRNTFLYILTFCCLLLNACKPDKPALPGPAPGSGISFFSGYTGTDATGNLTGPFDSTDWNTNDIWSSYELGHFANGHTNTSCTFIDTLVTVTAYPNPTTGLFALSINTPAVMDSMGNISYGDTTSVTEVYIQKQSGTIYGPFSNKINKTINFDITGSIGATDTMFRLYYTLSDQNGCVRMGHGDIRVN